MSARDAGATVREWDRRDRELIAEAHRLACEGEPELAVARLQLVRHQCADTIEAERALYAWLTTSGLGHAPLAGECLRAALDARVREAARDAGAGRHEQPRLFEPVAAMAGQTDLFNPDQED